LSNGLILTTELLFNGRIPALQVDHLMISNVDAGGEGWPWVDAFDRSPEGARNRLSGDLAASPSTTLGPDGNAFGAAAAAWGGGDVFAGHLPTVGAWVQAYTSLRHMVITVHRNYFNELSLGSSVFVFSGFMFIFPTSLPCLASRPPQVVHYCQNYRQGDWLFAKRRVPKGSRITWPPPPDSILSCAHPLLAVPPTNLSAVLSFPTNDGGTKRLKPQQAARVNFVLRTATHGVNAAVARFKRDVCSSRVELNLARSYRLVPEHVERQAERDAKKQAQRTIKAKASTVQHSS
jgi:hypothetical protein